MASSTIPHASNFTLHLSNEALEGGISKALFGTGAASVVLSYRNSLKLLNLHNNNNNNTNKQKKKVRISCSYTAPASTTEVVGGGVLYKKEKVKEDEEGGRVLRVGIICGGPSAERGISLNSARSVLDQHTGEKRIEAIQFLVLLGQGILG